MPKEYRELHFSSDEIARAMYQYSRAINRDAMVGNPTDVKIHQEPEIGVKMRFGTKEVDFNAHEITAALIHFSREIGVPLAKRSRKALGIAKGDLVLKMWIG